MEALISNQIKDNYRVFLNSLIDSAVEIPQTNILSIQQQYLDLVENKTPINVNGVEIDFNSDRWDFRKLARKGQNKAAYIYNFTQDRHHFNKNNEIIQKLFVLYAIKNSGIHSSVNRNFPAQRDFLMYLQDFDIELSNISLADVESYLNETKITIGTAKKKKNLIDQLLSFVSQIAGIKIAPDILEYLRHSDVEAINAEIQQNKTPLLPSDFYNEFTNLLLEQRNDFTERDNIICRLLFLQTQTGLRMGEILLLSTGNVKTIEAAGKTAYYLEYKGTKTASHKQDAHTISRIAVSKQFYDIFCELEKIVSKYPKAIALDTIAYNPETEEIVLANTIERVLRNFCAKNANRLNLINRKDADRFSGSYTIKGVSNHSNAKLFQLEPGSVVSYPSTRQFRVYCATELYNRGVSDELVAQMYGHKTLTMYHYYCRDTHPVQEDINYSQELVKEIVRDDLTILGPKGDSFKGKINSIITDNNLTVAKDLNEIINKVCNEMPIRAKAGGFCVKSNPRRECFHDAKTDEYMCAYGCCPNHCHLFFMAPISYDKCKEHESLVRYNFDNGFIKAAQKEAYLLKNALEHELKPELTDLKKELDKQGDGIITNHKELKNFVQRIDMIESEVHEWESLITKILD